MATLKHRDFVVLTSFVVEHLMRQEIETGA